MPVIVETPHGRLRGAKGSPSGWLLECPGCSEWLPVSQDMLHGRISVDHDHDGCTGHYHETHDFAGGLPCEACGVFHPWLECKGGTDV